MEDAKWERYAALGGFAFVVLNVVGAFLPGAPPAIDDSVKKITAYFNDHADAIKAGQMLAGIGTIGLLWWLGSLWRMMCRAENERPRLAIVAAISLVGAGTLALVGGIFTAEAAVHIDTLKEGSTLFFDLATITLATTGFFIVAFLSAVCALNYRTKMMPMWTSLLGWIAAALMLVGTLASVSGRAVFGFVGFGSFLVFCVWILAVSTFMWRGASSTTAPTS
jgi:hypothetical protein